MKKKHIVVPRTASAMENGIPTSKGTLKFNGRTSQTVSEETANEIEVTSGLKGTGDVWTHEDPILSHQLSYKEDGHSYIFGPSKAFTDAWEAFEKRRKDKKEVTK